MHAIRAFGGPRVMMMMMMVTAANGGGCGIPLLCARVKIERNLFANEKSIKWTTGVKEGGVVSPPMTLAVGQPRMQRNPETTSCERRHTTVHGRPQCANICGTRVAANAFAATQMQSRLCHADSVCVFRCAWANARLTSTSVPEPTQLSPDKLPRGGVMPQRGPAYAQ